MITAKWTIVGMLLLTSGLAYAQPECRFEGRLGKKELTCTADIRGTCNTLSEKMNKGLAGHTEQCSGFEVRCNGKTITEGESQCTGTNTQNGSADPGITHFQFTDSVDDECVYPRVIFSTLVPNGEKVPARLYFSEEAFLFGFCRDVIL